MEKRRGLDIKHMDQKGVFLIHPIVIHWRDYYYITSSQMEPQFLPRFKSSHLFHLILQTNKCIRVFSLYINIIANGIVIELLSLLLFWSNVVDMFNYIGRFWFSSSLIGNKDRWSKDIYIDIYKVWTSTLTCLRSHPLSSVSSAISSLRSLIFWW